MSPLPPAVEAGIAAIRRRQLDRAYARLGGREGLDAEERRSIEDLADAIVAGVLRGPAEAVRTGAADPAVAARVLPTEDGRVEAAQASSDPLQCPGEPDAGP